MSKLVEEIVVVVERHPPFCCEVRWSVVGNGSGVGSSYRNGCRIVVQRKGRLSTWAEKKWDSISHLTTLVWMRYGGLTNVDAIRGREAAARHRPCPPRCGRHVRWRQ